MKRTIEKLKSFNKQIDLRTRFNINFDVDDQFFTSSEVNQLKPIQNGFDLNIKLKQVLCEKYKVNVDQNLIDYWIINVWGGIRGFKSNERNIEKIIKFKKEIRKGKLSLESFGTISSLSKIASFLEPDNYVIYDSRVIYTLNWLILTCENQNGFRQKYFPIPNGRNKKMNDFDLKTILNLTHLSEYSNQVDLFNTPQTAYFEFCDFVKIAGKEIFGPNSKPFELEMLLFTLADEEIFQNLKSRLKLKID